MYYYIVDPQKISQSDFERVQNSLYSSLSDYRISGEVMRVTGLRTINQLVENAFAHGVKTLVAVGSDETLHDVINASGSREVTFGYIPLIETEIAEMLGIKSIDQAAKTIGARRITELDLGRVNNNFFLSKLSFGTDSAEFEVKFAIDGQFQASTKVVSGVISNNQAGDGVADISLLPKLGRWNAFKFRRQIQTGDFSGIPNSSLIHANRIEIAWPEGLPLRVGSRVIAKTPAVIEIVPKALRIIVGKDRKVL